MVNMTISAPENVVRAVQAAPETQIRNILLGALGFNTKLEPLSPELRNVAEKELATWFEMENTNQGEIPF